ncbi:unnamed protein product [Ilex paraguariensis]
MSSKGLLPFSSGDRAVRLDLIGMVQGLDAAESYFSKLSDQEKNEKTYGALLNCYVRERLIDKSLSHVQKMKEIGFASSSLVYNNLMCLYVHTNQLEKIPDVLSEMKKNGVPPNNFSYRICINSYGAQSDLNSIEKLLKEMESRPHLCIDWTTYSTLANFYIKAGLKEKALAFLWKLEEKLDKNALGYNHLISHYAHLGITDQMMRLWGIQKVKCKKQINRDYITMLGSLVKLGELEKTEALFKEWESSCQTYDFRVPNILLIGHCQKGLVERAETMLQEIIKKGKTPTPNSWSIIAAGYLDKENMEKAFECIMEALAVKEQNQGWRPKPRLISSILNWLGDEGEAEKVEAFVSSLKTMIPVNREMYHALLKANIRVGREVELILESMKAEKIDEDEETRKILSLKQESAE